MKNLIVILFACFLFPWSAYPQKDLYRLQKTRFSTPEYDEFSPVFYDNKLVYCSNKKQDVLMTYRGTENNLPLNLYLVERKDSLTWGKEHLFNRRFSSLLHDGPATFTHDFSSIIYSRNIDAGVKFRNVVNSNNKLGLFISEKEDGEWTEPVPFPYNSNDYSITTPAYDPEGRFVVFASDMPGGYGGADLYISRRIDGGWLLPENLGEGINTHASEAYPFISACGDLYFSSNGYKGLGGKDLLCAKKAYLGWSQAVLLDEPLNSIYDDISICTDDYLEEGFIASNREHSDDIFSFKARYYPFKNCVKQKEGQYCYLFSDDNASENTTPFTKYQWEFSDGTTKEGTEVEHCFAKPGHYGVKLNLIDEVTGNTFFTKRAFEFDIEEHIQAYINTVDVAVVGEPILMDGLKSHVPDIEIKKYYWQLGDDEFETSKALSHAYSDVGEYKLQLGLIGVDSLGIRKEYCAHRWISIYEDHQKIAAQRGYRAFFENFPSNAQIDSINGGHVVNPQTDAYIFGFNFAKLPPKENRALGKLVKSLNYQSVSFSDAVPQGRMSAVIDSLVALLKRYPDVKIEFAIHTDISQDAEESMKVTQFRGDVLVKWLIERGISATRLNAIGYGDTRPIDLFKSKDSFDLELNNRLEIIVLRYNLSSFGNRLVD